LEVRKDFVLIQRIIEEDVRWTVLMEERVVERRSTGLFGRKKVVGKHLNTEVTAGCGTNSGQDHASPSPRKECLAIFRPVPAQLYSNGRKSTRFACRSTSQEEASMGRMGGQGGTSIDART